MHGSSWFFFVPALRDATSPGLLLPDYYPRSSRVASRFGIPWWQPFYSTHLGVFIEDVLVGKGLVSWIH